MKTIKYIIAVSILCVCGNPKFYTGEMPEGCNKIERRAVEATSEWKMGDSLIIDAMAQSQSNNIPMRKPINRDECIDAMQLGLFALMDCDTDKICLICSR